MKITKEKAQRLWRERYGCSNFAFDFHGNLMVFEGYGKPEYTCWFNGRIVYCGWNIHHVYPKSKGGSTTEGNLLCTNIFTNRLAADKITFWIDNVKSQVRKTAEGYGIVRL